MDLMRKAVASRRLFHQRPNSVFCVQTCQIPNFQSYLSRLSYGYSSTILPTCNCQFSTFSKANYNWKKKQACLVDGQKPEKSMCHSYSTNRDPLPSQAQVVVCGGGAIGASVALHLAMEGWKDVVLIEQGR